MKQTIKLGFRQEIIEVPLEQLVALKEEEPHAERMQKFKQLRASLEHVGLIEPLAVYPQGADRYLVVNGNLRFHLLKKMGVTTARCTVALDDEAYSYNRRVNPLSPITEHFMILKAIANGVTEERIAKVLDIDVKAISRRRNLLDGICPEAVELLKDRRITPRAFSYLRKMKPLRQIEAAELMNDGKNYTVSFVASILGVTKPDQLVKPERESAKSDVSTANLLVEQATDNLINELAVVKRTYGTDVLALTVACRSIEKLTHNPAVKRYVKQHHPGVLNEIQQVIKQVNSERDVK